MILYLTCELFANQKFKMTAMTKISLTFYAMGNPLIRFKPNLAERLSNKQTIIKQCVKSWFGNSKPGELSQAPVHVHVNIWLWLLESTGLYWIWINFYTNVPSKLHLNIWLFKTVLFKTSCLHVYITWLSENTGLYWIRINVHQNYIFMFDFDS